MSQSDRQHSIDSTTDVEIARILDQYMVQVESGTAVSREEFIEQHPDHAERLRECLGGLDLISGKPIDTSLPSLFGDFEIRGELGRGGMGVVYEAYQQSLDRIVALKVMKFGTEDATSLERFQREAETAGGLHHTNIVPVFSNGTEGGTNWYAMQRIDGESLDKRIDRVYHSDAPSLVSIGEVVDIGIQAADALDYAHKRDVIHRDVKPANLIVDKQGVVWLTDFGLARRLVDVRTTMSGAWLGTPRYMSPEQADANTPDVTHHSDIFSLGATLYELATGRPPFDGNDPVDVIAQIRNADPTPPQTHRRNIPRDLEVVLLKALAKRPSQRYESASAFAQDLRAVREGRPIQARAMSWIERSVRWTRKHEHLIRPIGIAVVTTVAAVLLLLSMLSTSREQSRGQFRIRAAGGPFAATIRNVDVDADPLHVTVPMQDVQTVKKGNYTMQLAPNGRWSRTVRFHVGGGESDEFRFRYQDGAKRELSIADSQAVPTADFDAPAMLLFKGDTLRRLAANSDLDWETQLENVSAQDEPLFLDYDSANPKSNVSDASSKIDFRYVKSSYTPWSERSLEGSPRLATPVRALETAIDLDGDMRSDTVVASPGNAALLALNADGNQLWCKRYLFPQPAALAPDEWAKKLVLPGVLDMHAIDDMNNDGIDDLVTQIIRIQPSVQNDVCIAVLSGKTGEIITAIECPPIAAANQSIWPPRGMLLLHDDHSRRSPLIFSSRLMQEVYRPVYSRTKTVVYKANFLNSSFALPLPLATHVTNGRTYSVQCIGDRTTVFDLASGTLIGKAITGVAAYETPIIVMENDAPRIVMLARDIQTDSDVVRIQSLNGQQCWATTLTGIDRTHNSNLKYTPSWPLVEDLDSDGIDEVIAPVDFKPFTGMGVQAYRLTDGTPLWSDDVRQFAVMADGWIERIAVTADVNDDGWRDIASVTIGGKARPIKLGGESGDVGKAYVYVDWLSGATGEPISWARHPIPVVSHRVEVCEIDGVRSDLHHADRGVVEVELVTGESRQEDRLECMTIRFSPHDRQATSVANGVTVCGNSATLAGRGPRWYRRRPGTFGLDEERLVLLDEPDTQLQRLGENRVIAVWNRDDPILAVEGDKPNRISAIRAKDLSTLWSAEALPKDARFQTIRVADDKMDVLAPSKDEGDPTNITRLDGLTGQPVWSHPTNLHGTPVHAQYIHNPGGDSVLVIDNGRNVKAVNKEAFNMSLLNARTGKLIWNRPFLDDASSLQPPKTFANFAITDVNGDNIADICGPDQDSTNAPDPVLGMTMWDGRNGEKLWTRSWSHAGYLSMYQPMPWSLLRVEGRQCIAFIEPTIDHGSYRETPASIVVCSAEDGSVVARIDTEYQMYPRAGIHGARIADITSAPNKPKLAVWLLDDSLVPQLIAYDVSMDGLLLNRHYETDCQRQFACWLFDVTGDDVPEAFAVAENELSCYSMSGTLLWSTSLFAQNGRGRYYSWDRLGPSVHGAVWQESDSNRLAVQWIDLRSGRALHQIESDAGPSTGDSAVAIDQLLPVAIEHRDSNVRSLEQRDLTYIAASNDGIFIAEDGHAQAARSMAEMADPRRIKRLPISQIHGGDSLIEFLMEQAKRLLVAFALLVMPLVYMHRVIRHRRWTLRSFLLAPAVLMFFLVAWRNVVTTNVRGDLIVTLLNGMCLCVALYGIVATLRASRFGLLIIAVIAAIFVLSVLCLMNQDENSPFRFVVNSSDLVLLILVMLFVTGQLLGVFHALRHPVCWLARRFVPLGASTTAA